MAATTGVTASAKTAAQPTVELDTKPSLINVAIKSGISAGFCAFVVHTLTFFPAGAITVGAAAVFGGSSSLVRNALRYATDQKNQGFLITVAKTAFVYIAAAAAGTLFTKALGLSITFSAALKLSAIMFATALTVGLLFTSCAICLGCAIGIATLNSHGKLPAKDDPDLPLAQATPLTAEPA